MKKLVIMAFLATLYAYGVACTAPEISTDEYETHGTEKSKSVNSKGSSTENDLEDELDNTEY